jgi:hypothetical protein
MRVYADVTHARAIKDILLNDDVSIDDIEYAVIEFGSSLSPVGILSYYRLLKKVFTGAVVAGADKVFFLSFNSIILYLIKKLKQSNQYSGLRFALVLHGEFEKVADDALLESAPPLPVPGLATRIRRSRLMNVPGKALRFIGRSTAAYCRQQAQLMLSTAFPLKKMLLWKHSDDFRYIALSPHIAENASKYLNARGFRLHTVVMPTAFAAPLPLPSNRYPKFAVFGYGNASTLHQVLLRLSKETIEKPYEIRIIGMDSGGAAGFENITTPAQGRALSRAEMEKYVKDIDIFLILYPKDRYRLSCTGSILEALSYMKPVLHFENDCLNTFNTAERPIGIRASTVDEYVHEMVDIITSYPPFVEKVRLFRDNISELRKELSIANSKADIRNSFTWPSTEL